MCAKMVTSRSRSLLSVLVPCVVLLTFCEFLIYYLVLLQCSWPELNGSTSRSSATPGVKMMVLADTHLIGPTQGHWFDKLRREWQMYRAFQTAMAVHGPDIVFILGDLFDEGKWSNDIQFETYVRRFKSIFYTPANTKLFVTVGNHDVGFHYDMSSDKLDRFSNEFHTSGVNLVHHRNNIFVLINSMAMERDGCNTCRQAESQLRDISTLLQCSEGTIEKKELCSEKLQSTYTRPIILQHFPLYRKDDTNCTGPDSRENKKSHYRESLDCLSKESTKMLLDTLKPRLVLSGHTHFFCQLTHPGGVQEWTVPSFSWRNNHNPSFLLVTLSNEDFAINKCLMPSEITVIWTYILGITCLTLWQIKTLQTFYMHLSGRSKIK